MSPRTALAAGLLATGLATAGCGADVNLGDPTPSATAPAPTTVPTTVATTVPTTLPATTAAPTTPAPTTAGSGPAGTLPATFPLPPGATVTRAVTDTEETDATLTVPDGKQAYAFWTSALPAAGYTVSGAEMVGGIGSIDFSGPGCPGASQIGVSGADVSVQCRQG